MLDKQAELPLAYGILFIPAVSSFFSCFVNFQPIHTVYFLHWFMIKNKKKKK